MVHALFILLTLLLTVATVLPALDVKQWWVRVFDFPRLQMAITGGLLVVAYCLLFADGEGPGLFWLLLLLACLAVQLYWIWPYTELHRQEVLLATAPEAAALPRLRLISSNVLMDNRDASRLIALVQQHQPDVFVTLESDRWWQSKLDALDEYPHRIACPLDNRYGMHVYSRLPLAETSIDFLVEDDIPSMAALFELPDGPAVRLHVVHPTPPAPGENTRSTERDVELLMLAKAMEDCNDVTVVAGDLNDVAWSATTKLFRARSGLQDPRVGRGMVNTFHAQHWLARWPLDHFFLSNHWRLIAMQRLPDIGSDHFPVMLEIACGDVRTLDAQLDKGDVDTELEEKTLQSNVADTAQKPDL